jgi:NADPH:quinone reductase-like Zn-dependent oxidoreductase
MDAWYIRAHGGPEALERAQISDPVPGHGQVRVKVRAVGMNHLDLWVRKGVQGHTFPLPMVPGCDVTGEVESLGPGVDTALAARLKTGTRVLVDPILSCGHCGPCREDRPYLCVEFGLVGEHRDGGLARYLVVPALNLMPLPDSLDYVQAAALPIAYVTAWSMLVSRARLRAGEWVLVHAGGSGVSVAAIQIAASLGARVITTVGSPEKAVKTRELGAEHVILYQEQDFRSEVRALMKEQGRRGVDVVVDHVGQKTFSDSVRCLDWGGRLVTCGATTGADVSMDLKVVFFKSLSILGTTMGSRGDLRRVVDLVAAGVMRPLIDSVYSFDQAPEAFDRLEGRSVFGKIVVKVD